MSKDAEFIKQCQQLRAQGKEDEDVIAFLRAQGCSKTQSTALVAKALSVTLAQAKNMVHASSTWADVRERDEKIQDDLEGGLKKREV